MRWTDLGHATWLCEAAGLRILCDPLLAPTHHGGVYRVVPHREIAAERLRPDFVLVSHRHPDHFDVASLHRLARLDADTVVVTPDALVAWAARALGFRTVHQVDPGQRIDLDGVTLVTTPSLGETEWGVVVATDDGAVWNQVDTVLRDAAHTAAVRQAALAGCGRSELTLALVRWQPMLEIAAQVGDATAFPQRDYARLLGQIAALAPCDVVPSAAGGAHVGPWAWLDRVAFPVPPERLARDLATLAPGLRVHPPRIGATYHVDRGLVRVEPDGGASLLRARDEHDPRVFAPLAIPELVDPNLPGYDVASMRRRIDAWIETDLAAGLARAWPALGTDAPLRCVLEVVYPDRRDAHTLVVDDRGTACTAGFDRDWDALDGVVASLLFEVIEGRRSWGDTLLAGALRGRTRAYAVEPGRLRALPLGVMFVYYGLSYDDSVERAVRAEVAAQLATDA